MNRTKSLVLLVLLSTTAAAAVMVTCHLTAEPPVTRNEDNTVLSEELSGSLVLPEEYDVYSAIIQDWYSARMSYPEPGRRQKPTPALVLISSLTVPDKKSGNEYEWPSKQLPSDLQQTTIENYFAKNQSGSALVDSFTTPAGPLLAGHTLIDGAAIQSLILKHDTYEDWMKFIHKYPENASPIWQFSRVGFNRKMDQALVKRSEFCGPRCGDGGYCFMVKEAGGWRIKREFGTWMS